MNKSQAGRFLLLSVGLVLSQARAQAAEPAAAPLTEVVVTASRVARDGFTAPTPTTVIGPELLEQRAITNMIDIINEQPAFRNTATQQSNSSGAGGLAGVDLRGLGTIRTLVLVNGRRHVPTSNNGTVNINLIPASLIERTEVVTGGASAAWGSDAAGVVNLILKNDLQGLESNVSYGASTQGDFNEYNISLAGGTSFADGRGHFMAGAEYVDNKGVGRKDGAREWAKERWWTI
jgi:iron complex outermembrane receptor protein